MIEKYKEFKKSQEKFEKELKEYVKDPSISLEERWNTFITCGIGNTDWRTTFNNSIEDEWLYEAPLYMDKYQTMDVKYMLEAINEDEQLMTDEQIIKFKEYCLKNFMIKMKFDW